MRARVSTELVVRDSWRVATALVGLGYLPADWVVILLRHPLLSGGVRHPDNALPP